MSVSDLYKNRFYAICRFEIGNKHMKIESINHGNIYETITFKVDFIKL